MPWVKPKKRKYTGLLSYSTDDRIRELIDQRKMRAGDTMYVSYSSAIGGSLLGSGVVYLKPLSIGKDLLIIGISSAVGGIAAGATAFKKHSKLVKDMTRSVGKGLVEDAKKDNRVDGFLKHCLSKGYKYIIIDRKGFIKAVKSPRIFGIGRMRLNIKDILEGNLQSFD